MINEILKFAAKPIVRYVGLGVTALVGGIGIKKVIDNTSKNSKRIGILGMQGAGKTRFLCYLRNVPYIERQTSIEEYEGFQFEVDGIKLSVKSGNDIGGGDNYMIKYEEIIKNSDYLLYFFDIAEYLKEKKFDDNNSYRRYCNSRFEFINSKSKIYNKKISIIGTHIDLISQQVSHIKNDFIEIIKNKPYSSILNDFELINLNEKKSVITLINKVFK